MKMNYISKIQANLKGYKTIKTNRATSRLLDGSYVSIYKGRSMNFDELREYVQGDDVKDIDWKASSRSQKMLVRQYVAEKKHNIMLVMDTNSRMQAYANDTQEKCEIAYISAGTMAYLANSNGDYVSAIYATEQSINFLPFKTGLMNIENIMSSYHKAVNDKNKSDINKPLEYIIHNFKRRMIIMIVTDLRGIHSIDESVFKRLLVMHDVLVINVADANSYGKNVYSLDGQNYLPEFFTKDKKLKNIEETNLRNMEAACEKKLKKYGVATSIINSTEEIDDKIIELLNKHRIEKR